MYKKFKSIDEREKRVYMAGLSLTQMIGFKTVREFCLKTVLLVGDIDTDEMIFFSNSINRDVKHSEDGHTDRFSDYFNVAVDAYLAPAYLEEGHAFFDRDNLRRNFERGKMSDSIEYPCYVVDPATGKDDVIWIRACYELEQIENGHILATVALLDISHLRAGDPIRQPEE